MNKFIITIDSSCDCAIDELKSKNIHVIFFNYNDQDNTYTDTMDEKSYKDFYEAMRNGAIYKTSQINPNSYYEFFKPLLKDNLPIIHISLGSGLSNTINSIYIAINLLKEEDPSCDIRPIDSKTASLGLTILLDKLVECRDNGMDVDEAFDYVNNLVNLGLSLYTTDTLTYFARGGRLSKVSAFLGNAIRINPVLDVDFDGKLRITDKVRGSKKAIQVLINRVKSQVVDASSQTIYICHADAEEKAKMLGEKLVSEVGFKNYKIYFMGPIIGAHTGPGLVAVFFFGKGKSNTIPPIENQD